MLEVYRSYLYFLHKLQSILQVFVAVIPAYTLIIYVRTYVSILGSTMSFHSSCLPLRQYKTAVDSPDVQSIRVFCTTYGEV